MSVKHFVDRVFLTWYSSDAIAAVMPAGILSFTILSLFLGTATYVNTFVAQYHGAGRYDRIGPAVWQGAYVAAVGAAVHLLLIPAAGHVFAFVGHEQAVQQYEVVYFQTLCLGAGPAVAAAAMSGFFTGRGKTWTVMWVNIASNAVNLVLDYALIFGVWGLPKLGVRGAAIATVISTCFSLATYLVLLSRPMYDRRYHTLRGWQLDRQLFGRLMRFGLPSGVQFFIDIAGFAIFILLVGRFGTMSLAATNIALNISTLAFMPMIGLGIAVSVMVGQHLGRDRADLAERSTYSGFHLTFSYMAVISASYVLVPYVFLAPFAAQADPQEFEPIRRLATVLLRFVAVYSLFDAVSIIFSSAIKGAGDTRYVMFMIGVASAVLLVIPTYLAVMVFDAGIYAAWCIASAYIITLSGAFLFRFLGGKWKSMKVIEEPVPTVPTALPETPAAEREAS